MAHGPSGPGVGVGVDGILVRVGVTLGADVVVDIAGSGARRKPQVQP